MIFSEYKIFTSSLLNEVLDRKLFVILQSNDT